MLNVLTIDVEDYFHVSAFEKHIRRDQWHSFELRVEQNTCRILHLLDEHDVKATFFVLGWVAERCPQLVKAIAAAGHEVASHGYGHQRVGTQSRNEFREDVRRSKYLLEDLTGCPVNGYRAPSYSISRETFWAFDELHGAGYRYDSSIFPVRHDFYGIPDWPRFAGWAVRHESGTWEPALEKQLGRDSLFELPITTLRLGNKNLPIAGGGYFRLFPYDFTRWGLRRINRQDHQPFIFYLHPWEMDAEQPRINGAGAKSRFRHYLNLDKTEARIRRLLQDFDFASISHGMVDGNLSSNYADRTLIAGYSV
jgi:polysaccharide deacetylase family protein (PEP-CTERM system associated)